MTPSTGAPYEVSVLVLGAPYYSKSKGTVSYSYQPDLGVGGLSSGEDSSTNVSTIRSGECGYQHGRDLIIPTVFTIRATTTKPVTQQLFIYLDTTYGFQNPGGTNDDWAGYSNSIGFVGKPCDLVTVQDEDSKPLQFNLTATALHKSFGTAVVEEPVIIEGGGLLSKARQNLLLSSLAFGVHVEPSGSNQTIKLGYSNPSQTRLLQGNGCLAIFVPLSLTVPRPLWHTPAAEKCDNPAYLND